MLTHGLFNQDEASGLPVPSTPLIGREAEVAAVRALVRDAESRLIVLTGPGGVGKTRLALQVAAEMGEAFDVVCFVPLAAVSDPNLVLSTIARGMDIAEGDRPLFTLLVDALERQRTLLILDNFEHLLPATPIISNLLTACPRLKALVTSRTLIGAPQETSFAVPPLALPDQAQPVTSAEELAAYAGTWLFATRARLAKPDLIVRDEDAPIIAAICRRLDGLPLAIELAAARMSTRSAPALLADLERRLPILTGGPDSAPDRLRTMRDAIAWSYDLLTPTEQAIFRRLSVFAGGFTLDAAATLIRGHPAGPGYPINAGRDAKEYWWLYWGRDSPPIEMSALPPIEGAELRRGRRGSRHEGAEDGTPSSPAPSGTLPPPPSHASILETLVDQSLLRRTYGPDNEPRYEMLETIREYGLEKLDASGEGETTRDAHAAWALAFSEIAGGSLSGPVHRQWASRLDAELNNLRAALAWTATRPDRVAVSLRMSEAIWIYWQTRGHISEGRAWLDSALARPGGPPWERAAALNASALLAWIQNDVDHAQAAAIEALAYWREIDHKMGAARALQFLGLVAWTQGDFRQMVDYTEKSLVLHRDWQGYTGVGMCLIVLAIVARGRRDYARAMTLLEQARDACLADATPWLWCIATSYFFGGEVAREQGDLTLAAASYMQGLDHYAEYGDPWGAGASIAGLAALAAHRGEATRAARLFGAADVLCAKIGAFLPTVDREGVDRSVATVREHLGDTTFATAFATGRTLSVDDAIAEARLVARAVTDNHPPPPATYEAALTKLTRRQRDVLPLIAAGRGDQQIADALFLSVRSAEDHVRNICDRLSMTRREIIAAYGSHPDTLRP